MKTIYEEIRLWTIQPLAVWEQLQKIGTFRCDANLAKCMKACEFESAYQWMAKQMWKRIGEPPTGVTYPIWAWHTLEWQHKKPDLRRMEFRGYRGKHVCMEIEISEDKVLLSDEADWHFVLNDSYMPSAQNQKALDRQWESFEHLLEEEKRVTKEKSWESIFTVSPPLYDEWNQTGRYIQATFWELNLDQVRDVRYFGK
ncbi:MAG: DUF3841 domain-containing protein [Eubacterium aggregans]|uniref:DUF3841 domain-containing protein n=1 Tax=Eubacterium aggregans TaxID=81409 RepID=UPI002B21DA11|nr:DUF3841 domain-containing protein [Eubacterium aggregans]MEA5074223.1 DUF3841 domain-containing protein [Eubacterium aggregans]